MKARFQQLAGRFDALSARQRVLLVAGALLGVILGFFMLALEPKLVAKKRLTQQIGDMRQASTLLQQQLKAVQGQDPGAARRAERDALRRQLADIDKTMGTVQRGLVPPERTARLLQEMLRSGGGLQLVSLRTLPVQRFDAARLTGGGETSPAANDAERQLYQHGFEITVQGSYADLHDYLRRVEQLPWRLFWTRINVTVNPEKSAKVSMTLTVQTVSLSKAWLIV
jgi:MSHA biogenesis protein MshJ